MKSIPPPVVRGVVRLPAVAMLAAIFFAVLGCGAPVSVEDDRKLDPLLGLWTGEAGYLYVEKTDTGYAVYSSIEAIRQASWRKFGDDYLISGDLSPRALLTLKHGRALGLAPGLDPMEVSVGGEPLGILERDRASDATFLGGLGAYSNQCDHCLAGSILYPDGIGKLALVYLVAAPLGAYFFVFGGAGMGLGKRLALSGGIAVLPLVVGYGYLGGRWFLGGWTDPYGAGRVVVVAATVVLLALVGAAFHRGRLGAGVDWGERLGRWSLLLVDGLGIVLNLIALFDLVRGA